MGNARWDADNWSTYAASTKGKDRATVFASRTLSADLDPAKIIQRESVDSPLNPNSTPIIVALDVTGSMGQIPHQLIQGSLGTLMEELLGRRPVPDPHLMFMGVGDADFDSAPLQVTQFEADVSIADQLRAIFIEGGGGGNHCESYHLPWYFAGMKTKTDAMIKRGTKGYLFTVGDEEPPSILKASHVRALFGDEIACDMPTADALALAEQFYHVFHVVIEQGSHYRSHGARVLERWRDLLGQRVVLVSDHQHLAEVIVSTIQANEGADHASVAGSWSSATSLVVSRAIKGVRSNQAGTDLVRFG